MTAPEGREPLRVACLVAPAPTGGLETVVQTLVGAAPRAGIVPVLIVLDQMRGVHPFVDAASRAGLAPLTVDSGRRRYFAEASAVADRLESVGAQVLHTHGYHADLVGLIASRRMRLPIVSTAHGQTGGGMKNRLFELLQRRAFRRFDRVIAVSEILGEQLVSSGVPRARLEVVRNAFAPVPALDRAAARAALGIDDESFRLGWIGRISPEKGPDLVVDALAQVADLPLTLSVVGDGPGMDAMKSQAAALGVSGRITWHGLVLSAASHLAAFDAVVLSSRTEGTPMVLLEAMAVGVPVIATAVGGIPGVVSESEAVLVPEPRAALLADAVRRMTADPAGAAARVTAARTRLDAEFSVDPWIERHRAIYLDAIEAGSPARRS